MPNRHLLEDDEHLRALREFNDLELIGKQVDWELFRPLLEEIFGPPRTEGLGIILSSFAVFCWGS